MKTTIAAVALVLVIMIGRLPAAEGETLEMAVTPAGRSATVSLIIRGAHCDQDVEILQAALRQLKGIKLDPDDIGKGEGPRYFTDPFVVEMTDVERTDIGALASAVAAAQTPHREDIPPKLNLVLYTTQQIDESSVVALRQTLMDVNGLEVVTPGGLGGFPARGFYWIQLEDAGGAALSDVLAAAKESGIELSLKKP